MSGRRGKQPTVDREHSIVDHINFRYSNDRINFRYSNETDRLKDYMKSGPRCSQISKWDWLKTTQNKTHLDIAKIAFLVKEFKAVLH